MAVQLTREVAQLLREPETVKALATVDENGNPQVVIKQTIHLAADGQIVYLELLESSRTNKNMIRSLWFDRKVAVVIKGKDGNSYQILGRPVRAIITGPVFEKYYTEVRQKLGDVDLATVWKIKPESIINESFPVRKTQEEERHPIFTHLDRIAR